MPNNYHLHLRGQVGGWNFDSGYVSYILDSYKDKEVNVLIDSLGGRVDTALTITSLFKIHGNVHAHFVGMNASAATIAAMGAKRVTIDSGACFLVHKCLNFVCEWDYMNADQLDAHIAELQKLKDDQNTIDSCIAGIYAKRCKKPKNELLDLMKVGGWLTPQQAKEWGFVDEITDYEEDEKPVLTDTVASALCAAGTPLPPVPLNKVSFFDRLKKLFTSQPENDNQQLKITASEPPAPPTKNTQPYNMDQLPLLAAILGASVTMSGDNASLSADQLSKLEAAMKDKDSKINDLTNQISTKDTEIANLNKTVADLKKAPADSTDSVTENSQGTKSDGPGDNIDDVVDRLAKAWMA